MLIRYNGILKFGGWRVSKFFVFGGEFLVRNGIGCDVFDFFVIKCFIYWGSWCKMLGKKDLETGSDVYVESYDDVGRCA